MHGRKCFFLFSLATIFLAGCAGGSLMQPDCHSCTTEDQEWRAFSWEQLSGQWRGSVETVRNQRGAGKKEKNDKKVEFRFLDAAAFLKAKGASCASLPPSAIVMNGQFWTVTQKSSRQEFEAFVPVEDDKVAYGRLAFEKMNGKEVCQFRRLGRVMGTNRLALPAVSFSETSTVSGRALASIDSDAEVNLEFLRFVPAKVAKAEAVAAASRGKGRALATVEAERPPLMIRVFKVSTRQNGARSEWSASEEQLYRLWKAE